MRRTRLTIATLSMAASAIALGVPAATAASAAQPSGTGGVHVVANDHQGDGGFNDEGRGRHRNRRHRHHRRVRIHWHHRCGRGWDSGYVRGTIRDRDRDRDRRFDGDRDFRDRDRRDNDRWPRGWISRCEWHRGERGERTSYAVPVGAVKAGVGGSVMNTALPEVAAGGALAAVGLAAGIGAMRRRSSN
ncbi:hypothetical protein NGB36_16825 [Streptomyces sp. RB6PN25]|uniref:Integral membrane protein n=1 Tax=Streptomyces humicola TaxID=2953240 RepID=A0ABT1PYV3_9ACTN|nr:hypothetical protein [Streptomyces humicola]MCQ4082225.1 hypothetical protein [Streptomyces humicola]